MYICSYIHMYIYTYVQMYVRETDLFSLHEPPMLGLPASLEEPPASPRRPALGHGALEVGLSSRVAMVVRYVYVCTYIYRYVYTYIYIHIYILYV